MINDWRGTFDTYDKTLKTYNNWAKAIGIPEKKIGDVIYLYEMEDLYCAVVEKAIGIEIEHHDPLPPYDHFGWAPIYETDSD